MKKAPDIRKWIRQAGSALAGRCSVLSLAAICLLAFSACEDVIQVEVPEEPPRLVVEGLIRVDTTEEYLPIRVRLSETAPFFGEPQLVRDVDEISIIIQAFDEDGNPAGSGVTEMWESDTEPGVYIPIVIPGDLDERVPMSIIEQDVEYTLVVTWRGRRYAAQTRYVPSVPIDRAELGDRTLFDEDETEVVVAFTDTPGEGDYYIFDFGFGEYFPSEDIFSDGEQLEFSYFYDQQFDPGTNIEISILGADQVFYNYMTLLVEQAGDSGNPFQTPVATVRGNVFDVTDLDNIDNFDNAGQPEIFPLGFFAIVQEFQASVTVD